MKDLAEEARSCLIRGDIEAYGEEMIKNNECQRSLHSSLISADADEVIAVAKKHQAKGWKVNGAGGEGGSLTLLSSQEERKRQQMIEEINSLGRGIRSIPVSLSLQGLTVRSEDPF